MKVSEILQSSRYLSQPSNTSRMKMVVVLMPGKSGNLTANVQVPCRDCEERRECLLRRGDDDEVRRSFGVMLGRLAVFERRKDVESPV